MQQDPWLVNILATGAAHCGSVAIQHGSLLASLFLAGLIGSLTHCVGMCGPFVLTQTLARLENRPAARMREFDRLAGAALIPYHLGRATTYAALGALAAALAAGAVQVTGMRWLSAALLLLAALFFIGYAFARVGTGLTWTGRTATARGVTGQGGSARLLARIARPLFARPIGWRGYMLGVALGFLPCGLLYGAIAAAAASGDPLAGAFAMLAFSLGTVPALLAVALAGHVAGVQLRERALRLAPVLMLVNAATLSYLAWRTVV